MEETKRSFLHTRVCDMLGIEYPIMNAGMGSIAGPELVAAVSNAGGLGSLGNGREGPEEMRAAIRKVRSLTSKPFAVQLSAPGIEGGKNAHLQPLPPGHVAFVEELMDRFHIPPPQNMPEESYLKHAREVSRQVFQVVLEERVPVLVTFFGNPRQMAAEAHAHGMKVISSVGKTKHARHCIESGSDILLATGYEAGGHSGPVGTMALVPRVVDVAGETPVMAAGGIMDGRGLVAALALGAAGITCGSAFLLCHEAGPFADGEMPPLNRDEALASWRVSDLRRQILEADEDSTVQSYEYSGGPMRKLKNAWTDAWASKAAPEPLPFGQQIILNRKALRGAYEARISEVLPNLVGQGVGMLKEMRPARQVILSMVQEAIEIRERMFSES